MQRGLLAVVAILVGPGAACSSASSSDGSTADGPWKDTAMQTIVATKCATSGCHDGSRPPNFVGITESDMRSNRLALEQVRSGLMPKSGSLTDEELKTFLAFYGE